MIVTRKAIPRRTILRGLGAALALPLLDGMVPALTALGRTAGKPTRRFGVVYVPNGIVMKSWTPASEGTAFELTPILQPLAPFRDRMQVLTGLNSRPPALRAGEDPGVHARASTRFLTDMPPKFTTGSDLLAGISMDQILAKELGQTTQLASLEVSMESTESAGTCNPGFSCAYTSTISWRSPTTPLPMENNPRMVFERLFGDSGSTDPAARLARMRRDRSILDSVTERASSLQRTLGSGDRLKLGEYLEAVRDVERRIQNAEAQNAEELPVVDHPAGIPATFGEHARLMYDLQVLAYQCDLTRVITFMMGREFTGRQYPEIGVPDAHHPISHHQGDVEKLAKLAKINTFHTALFAYYLEKLRSTPDGDGSLLDHLTLIYGAGMSDSNQHSPENLPVLLLGGGAGTLKGGSHVRYAAETPLADLHVTLLDKFGLPVGSLGDSTADAVRTFSL
jgi:hypothetical protein